MRNALIFRTVVLAVVAVFVLCLCATLFAGTEFASSAQAEVLKQGSTGATVKTIQQKLKNWGYYDGSVDGIFGSGTRSAVVYFQRTNGLSADGIVGSATAAAMGVSLGTSSGSSSTSSGVLKQGSSGVRWTACSGRAPRVRSCTSSAITG